MLFSYTLFEDKFMIGFARAVCSLSPEEVFSYFLQSTGAHCTSPGCITIGVRPVSGLLVDKQEDRRVSIPFTIYSKCFHIHAHLCFLIANFSANVSDHGVTIY